MLSATSLSEERRAILDIANFKVDPNRVPIERENVFYFAQPDDMMSVTALEPTITRGVCYHPEFEINNFIVRRENGREFSPSESRLYDEVQDGLNPTIVGAYGKMPVGTMKISLSPRSSKSHAGVITDQVFRLSK